MTNVRSASIWWCVYAHHMRRTSACLRLLHGSGRNYHKPLTHTAEINAYLYFIASGKISPLPNPSPSRPHPRSKIIPRPLPPLCPDHRDPPPGLLTSKGESKEGEGASTATAGLNLLAALLGAQAKDEAGDSGGGGQGGGAKRRGGQRDSFKINLFPEDPFDAAQAKGGDDGDLEVGVCPSVAPCCLCWRAFGCMQGRAYSHTGRWMLLFFLGGSVSMFAF